MCTCTMENTEAQEIFCSRVKIVSYSLEYAMSAKQDPPVTFRLLPAVEGPFESALERLGWTRTKLLNEALQIALPIILERQAARFQAPTKEAGAAAVRVARKPKRA